MPILLSETRNGVTTVTLNRPEAMNALSSELRAAISAEFARLRDDAATEVIILTGAGRAFCAGLDLKELAGEAGDASASLDAASRRDMVDAILSCPQPVIAAVNGVAITGGFELALVCDVLVGSTNARFADTHARVGILPGWGLSQRLSRLIGVSRAKEVSLTGNFVDAAQAERWGLLNHVLPPDELLPFCRKLAEDMLSCAPGMVRAYKRVIDKGFATTFEEGLVIEGRTTKALRASVRPEEIAERRAAIQDRGRAQGG